MLTCWHVVDLPSNMQTICRRFAAHLPWTRVQGEPIRHRIIGVWQPPRSREVHTRPLVCRFAPGRMARHGALNDICRALSSAGIPSTEERAFFASDMTDSRSFPGKRVFASSGMSLISIPSQTNSLRVAQPNWLLAGSAINMPTFLPAIRIPYHIIYCNSSRHTLKTSL